MAKAYSFIHNIAKALLIARAKTIINNSFYNDVVVSPVEKEGEM